LEFDGANSESLLDLKPCLPPGFGTVPVPRAVADLPRNSANKCGPARPVFFAVHYDCTIRFINSIHQRPKGQSAVAPAGGNMGRS
jgi:hypothetical protein